MEYIDIDECDALYSDFDNKTLNLVAELMGPEIRDKLMVPLVPAVDDVRLRDRVDQYAI